VGTVEVLWCVWGEDGNGGERYSLAILCPGLRLITRTCPASTYKLAQQSL